MFYANRPRLCVFLLLQDRKSEIFPFDYTQQGANNKKIKVKSSLYFMYNNDFCNQAFHVTTDEGQP
jgi:hypothetical protein